MPFVDDRGSDMATRTVSANMGPGSLVGLHSPSSPDLRQLSNSFSMCIYSRILSYYIIRYFQNYVRRI